MNFGPAIATSNGEKPSTISPPTRQAVAPRVGSNHLRFADGLRVHGRQRIMLQALAGREPAGVPNLTASRPTSGVTLQLREFALGFGSDFTDLGASPRLRRDTREPQSCVRSNRHRESRNEPTQTLRDRVPKASAKTYQARRLWASEIAQCRGDAGFVDCSDVST